MTASTGMPSARTEQHRQQLVWLIWLYFVLLVVEGALRKWLLPSLSDALLVVRDPVAAALVILGAQRGYLPLDRPMKAFAAVFIGFVALDALQLVQQMVPLTVLTYGLRTYFLHPPVIFVMARVLNAQDVRRLLIAALVLALPLALLMAAQFTAAPTDWINLGVGAGGRQIPSAFGKIRPAASFSFISGPVFYFCLSLAAVLASHIGGMTLPVVLRISAWVAIGLAASVSGSRSLLAGLVPVFVAAAIALIGRPRLVRRGLETAAIPVAVVLCLWSVAVVQEGVAVLDARFDQAGSEDMLARSRYEYTSVWWAWSGAPLLGRGMGLGTNAGGALAGGKGFQLAEGEWSRVLWETGPVFGVAFLAWRVWLAFLIGRMTLRAALRGYTLPLLLFAACANNLIIGPWGQPTALGFAVFGTGLSLAALAAAGAHFREWHSKKAAAAPKAQDLNPRLV